MAAILIAGTLIVKDMGTQDATTQDVISSNMTGNITDESLTTSSTQQLASEAIDVVDEPGAVSDIKKSSKINVTTTKLVGDVVEKKEKNFAEVIDEQSSGEPDVFDIPEKLRILGDDPNHYRNCIAVNVVNDEATIRCMEKRTPYLYVLKDIANSPSLIRYRG